MRSRADADVATATTAAADRMSKVLRIQVLLFVAEALNPYVLNVARAHAFPHSSKCTAKAHCLQGNAGLSSHLCRIIATDDETPGNLLYPAGNQGLECRSPPRKPTASQPASAPSATTGR